VEFNVTYDSSVTSNADASEIEGAMAAAVDFYEHVFRDTNITINVDLKLGTLPAGDIGHNNYSYETYSYSQIVAALKSHSTSPDDITAYTTLPASDPTGGTGDDYFLTDAQARVLGLSNTAPTYDDTITLGSSISYDYNPNDRAGSGDYDAIGVIEHEMSEGGLGRIGSMGTAISREYSALDLFSYKSPGVRGLTNGEHYFSLDGTHLLQEYNDNATNGGDIADWLPSIKGDSYGDGYKGVEGQVTPTDLRETNILGWTRTAATVDDFSGDGVSDVLFRDNATGDFGYYVMNGSFQSWKDIGASSTAYGVVGVGDFNGGYTDDILFQDKVNGDYGYFAMSNGGTGSGSGPTQGNNVAGASKGYVKLGSSSAAYNVVGTGDLYGTGIDDILFRDNATGDFGFEKISGGAIAGWHDLGAFSTAYNMSGIGDFYGNGTDDILFHDNATGDVGFVGMSHGASTGWHDLGAVSTAYGVVGVGDFTGSGNRSAYGTDDILFRDNATGDVGYLAMSNGINTGWHDLGAFSTAYTVAGVGDYYGNGTDDILFRDNATGDTGFWAISNGAVTGWHDIHGSSTAYSVPTFHAAPIA
jgi:hypothetical protein